MLKGQKLYDRVGQIWIFTDTNQPIVVIESLSEIKDSSLKHYQWHNCIDLLSGSQVSYTEYYDHDWDSAAGPVDSFIKMI